MVLPPCTCHGNNPSVTEGNRDCVYDSKLSPLEGICINVVMLHGPSCWDVARLPFLPNEKKQLCAWLIRLISVEGGKGIKNTEKKQMAATVLLFSMLCPW